MNRETLATQMKTLFSKAKAARAAGNKAIALQFRAGAKRVERKLSRLPKPVAKKEEAAS